MNSNNNISSIMGVFVIIMFSYLTMACTTNSKKETVKPLEYIQIQASRCVEGNLYIQLPYERFWRRTDVECI